MVKSDVDDILRSLGKYGRFQILQYTYNQLCLIPVVFPVLVYVFIGNIPDFQCRKIADVTWSQELVVTNDSKVTLEYHKCAITAKINDSNSIRRTDMPCANGYDYEGPETTASEWDLVCTRESLGAMSTTMVMIGQMLGASLFTSLADKYGRHVILYTTFIAMISCTLIAAAVPWFIPFVILRFLIGAFQQGLGLTLAALAIELFPTESRGLFIYINCVVWSLSLSIIAIFGFLLRNVSWRYTMLAAGLVGIHCFGTRWIVFESPRWLAANNKRKEMREWITRVAHFNGKNPSDILELYNDSVGPVDTQPLTGVEEELQTSHESYTILDIFRNRHILMTSIIVWTIWFVNSITYYGIFLTSGTLTGNKYLSFFINGVVEIPSLFVCIYTANKFGRKKTCVAFHAIAGVSLILSSILLILKDKTSIVVGFSALFNFMGKFGISGSFATIFLYTPEIYPTNLRSVGWGLASAAARIGGMLSPYSTMFASRIQWGPGVIFGTLSVMVTVLFLWLPETSGKQLPTNIADLTDFYVLKKKGENN